MIKTLLKRSLWIAVTMQAVFVVPADAADPPSPERAWHSEVEKFPRLQMLQRLTVETAGAAKRTTLQSTAFSTMQSSAAGVQSAATQAAQLPSYQVLDLGTLGGYESGGFDINDAGQVTGSAQTADGFSHAFIYQDGVMTDLGTLGGYGSDGRALNNAGQVTGASLNADGELHAFLYEQGVMKDLGTVTGTFSSGYAINQSGQVSGVSTIPGGEYHAMRYTAGNGMQDLGTLGDSYSTGDAINGAGEVTGIYSNQYESHAFLYSQGYMVDLVPSVLSYIEPYAKSINAAGHVAGSYRAADLLHAFLYRDGAAIDLGTLGGDFSSGVAINDASQVTGGSTTADGDSHAFLYSGNAMHDLGTLGGAYSIGYAINQNGDVAGTSATATGEMHAFVYKDGAMIDLGALGGTYAVGNAINKHGQVTGFYQTVIDGQPYLRGFIATPISTLFARLIEDIKEIRPRLPLLSARIAQHYYAAQNRYATCSALRALTLQLNYLGSHSSRRTAVGELADDVDSIEEALECR